MATERGLVNRLVTAVTRGERRVGLLLGSGVTVPAVPGVPAMLDLADQFVAERAGHPDLAETLRQVRAASGDRPAEAYAGYRRAFTEWVSPLEFDIVVQHAVLQAFRPGQAGAAPSVPARWERVGFLRGVALENELDAWTLPPGIADLGAILARWPGRFGHRVLTTNFDPLLEIAVRRAGGRVDSLSLKGDAPTSALDTGTDGLAVVHLHGYWRPTAEADDRAVLHDPDQLRARRDAVPGGLAGLLREETLCLVGYGGWDEALAEAIRGLAAGRAVDLLWALHGAPAAGPPPGFATGAGSQKIVFYHEVDSNRLFPALRAAFGAGSGGRAAVPRQTPPGGVPAQAGGVPAGGVPAPDEEPLATTETHRSRRRVLETQVGVLRSAGELLRQLDREFGWRREGAAPDVPPELLYWPVQLRSATLIHTVQALVAARLSACGMRVVLCIDDLNPPTHEVAALRDSLVGDINRWFGLVDGARLPAVVSLEDFHEPGRVAARLLDPHRLLRPTHPWAVEREYYRVHTLFDVVRAVKAVPDVEAADVEADAVAIATGLTTTKAERLLTPVAVWAHLHDILLDQPMETVVTLGGDDEALMWKLWHEVYPGPIRHIFNPRLANIRQDADMLRCGGYVDLRDRLERACRNPTWADEGHYPHWLAHNALLLPAYLCDRPSPAVGGRRLVSWEQVEAAIRDPWMHARAISAIAREVSTLCLHTN